MNDDWAGLAFAGYIGLGLLGYCLYGMWYWLREMSRT